MEKHKKYTFFSFIMALLIVGSMLAMIATRTPKIEENSPKEQKNPKIYDVYAEDINAKIVEILEGSLRIAGYTNIYEPSALYDKISFLSCVSQSSMPSYRVFSGNTLALLDVKLSDDCNLNKFKEELKNSQIFSNFDVYKYALISLPKEITFNRVDSNKKLRVTLKENSFYGYVSELSIKGDVISVSIYNCKIDDLNRILSIEIYEKRNYALALKSHTVVKKARISFIDENRIYLSKSFLTSGALDKNKIKEKLKSCGTKVTVSLNIEDKNDANGNKPVRASLNIIFENNKLCCERARKLVSCAIKALKDFNILVTEKDFRQNAKIMLDSLTDKNVSFVFNNPINAVVYAGHDLNDIAEFQINFFSQRDKVVFASAKEK